MFEKTKEKSSISFKEFQEKINVVNNFENDWGYFYDPDININININTNTNTKFVPNQYFQPKKQEEIFINIEKIYNKKKETDKNIKKSQDDNNVKESQDTNNIKESQDDNNIKESQDDNNVKESGDKNKTIMSWVINNILDHCELILITAIMVYFINNNI